MYIASYGVGLQTYTHVAKIGTLLLKKENPTLSLFKVNLLNKKIY